LTVQQSPGQPAGGNEEQGAEVQIGVQGDGTLKEAFWKREFHDATGREPPHLDRIGREVE